MHDRGGICIQVYLMSKALPSPKVLQHLGCRIGQFVSNVLGRIISWVVIWSLHSGAAVDLLRLKVKTQPLALTCIYIYVNTYNVYICIHDVCIMYICTYVYTYRYMSIYVYICSYIKIYIWMCMNIFVHVYLCVYVI